MRSMWPTLLLLLAGCAAAPPAPPPVPPTDAGPPLLIQLPESVRVERALMELASGEAARERHARAVLRAVTRGPTLDPLTALWRRSRPGSDVRLAALGTLIECTSAPVDAAIDERVAAVVRDIDRDVAGRFTTVLGIAHLRSIGDPAGEALVRIGDAGGPRADLARRLHAALFDPARGSQVRRP